MATTTRKATPAKAPAAKAPAFDFSTVTVTEAATMPTGTRGSVLDGSPVLLALTDSWNRRAFDPATKKEVGPVKEMTVPASAVGALENLVTLSAKRLGCGKQFRAGNTDAAGNVKVAFRARTKTVGTGRKPGSAKK